MTTADISMGYGALENLATEIENARTDFETMRSDFESLVSAMDGQWQGKAQREFSSGYDKLKPKLAKISKSLENYAAAVKKVAADETEGEKIAKAGFDTAVLAAAIAPEKTAKPTKKPKGFFTKEKDDDGINAYIGKASSEIKGKNAYAGVNAYVGKARTEKTSEFSFFKKKQKDEKKQGEWSEESTTSLVNAELGAGASFSILAADAETGIGTDMLGGKLEAEGSVGTAKAEAKGKFNISEDGVDVCLEGEAVVAAVEGKASGTINVLGIEIKLTAKGYAGAAGVEGKVGIDDNKFVADIGAAAGVGGSLGIEIGLNDEGWKRLKNGVQKLI